MIKRNQVEIGTSWENFIEILQSGGNWVIIEKSSKYREIWSGNHREIK